MFGTTPGRSVAHVEGCERRCTNILQWASVTQEWTHAVWQRQRQVPPASPDCHALPPYLLLGSFHVQCSPSCPTHPHPHPLSLALSLTHTPSFPPCFENPSTFLGAAGVYRPPPPPPPLHRLGEELLNVAYSAAPTTRPRACVTFLVEICHLPPHGTELGSLRCLHKFGSRIVFPHFRERLKLPCTNRHLRGLQTLPPASS